MRKSILGAAVLALGIVSAWGSRAEAQCMPVPIALDSVTGGMLAAGDCTIAQLGIEPTDTSFVDVYSIQVAVDGFLTARLESAAFDAFLAIFDQSLSQPIAFDDDGGGGTNAQVSDIPISPGTYLVLANSFSAGEIGAYTLTTSFSASGNPACDVVVDVPIEAVVNGSLSNSDCTIAALGLDPGDASFVDQYRVTLDEGGTLTARLESNDFDAFLAIFDETLTQELASHDDISFPDDTDSLISDLVLSPGSYRILTNSAFSGETGGYTLTLVPEPSQALLAPTALLLAAGLARRRRRGAAPQGRLAGGVS